MIPMEIEYNLHFETTDAKPMKNATEEPPGNGK